MTIYLSKEEVISGHYFMMKKMQDSEQSGVKDHPLLESAIYRPQQSIFGEDAYPTMFEKAAALVESLVKNHCFHNGNKRTAYLVVKTFIMVNGFHLKMERFFTVEFMVDIAKGEYSLKDIAHILKEHSLEK